MSMSESLDPFDPLDAHTEALAKAVAYANSLDPDMASTVEGPPRQPTPIEIDAAVRAATYANEYMRLLVCRQSWNQLITLAKRAQYVAFDAASPRGLSKFIADTLRHPQQVWHDARPEIYKDLDAARAEEGHAPLWVDFDHCDGGRIQRLIPYKGFPFAELKKVCAEHILSASPDQWRTLPALQSPSVQLGTLLEIWGQSMLIPEYMPTTPPRHYKAKKRQAYFSW